MQEKIIVCPREEKIHILKDLEKESSLHSIRFMTKEEYLQKAFFSYDLQSLYYLMKTYGFHIDVAKVYLQSLYCLEDKKYQSPKLQFLVKIKQELIENGLLSFSPSFSSYFQNKTIEVRHYFDLDLYEEKALGDSLVIPDVSLSTPVFEFLTMEEEVSFVCRKICDLLQQGVELQKIFLCNVSEDYYYTIQRVFAYYKIPVSIPFHNSIYGTKVIADYLQDKELPEVNENHSEIITLLKNVLEKLSFIDKDDSYYDILLRDCLKETYLENESYKNSVRFKNIYTESCQDDEYIFVLGMNQDSLPKYRRDISYLTDTDKKELLMYSTIEWNCREKKVVSYLLSQLPHVTISYKLSSPFSEYYPSPLIEEYSLEVIRDDVDSYQYSHFYNQLRLAQKLDVYSLYGEKSPYLEELFQSYSIPYQTYSNQFQGICLDTYLRQLPYPLSLSYTSLNSYNECGFQYYLKYVLKLNHFEDTFPSFVGSLYHKILSLYRQKSFDFELECKKYLEKRELSLKERLLFLRIKNDLLTLIDVLKEQDLLTGFNDALYEKRVVVPLDKEVAVEFVGYIDKIMYYKKVEDTYFTIIDYKTGTIDTNLEPMKYGLHMQLPVYLYLMHYGKVFDNPIFTGIYYQNILFSYPSWSPKLEQDKKNRYLLNGYSTDALEVLSRFDPTYENSEYIRSLKYKDDKFGAYSKILDEDTLYSFVQYTKNHISEKVDSILKADFLIQPKIYDGENVSCKYCAYADICFHRDRDNLYLDKQNDFSFLGGGE